MKTSSLGIELIKEFEGCKLEAYKCPAGVVTIGYGNTYYENKLPIKMGDKITKQRAEELLVNTLVKFEDIVKNNVKVPLNANQIDALVSYVFNTGGSSTLYKLINANAGEKLIRNWFETKYISAAGIVLPGLKRRRLAEANLFFTTQ